MRLYAGTGNIQRKEESIHREMKSCKKLLLQSLSGMFNKKWRRLGDRLLKPAGGIGATGTCAGIAI